MSPNRLADEASPYLLQHADNPVDWYPWGEEALARARELDKPILLSVGYAACHWCHVMAHESFEDEATAALMNEHFVSIKVDREERPDIDGIYMDAVQAMTGRGGWPMTAFLTPDGEPFYAGTYYPKEPSHGMPSFTQVLEAIAQTWSSERGKVTEQARKIVESIASAAGAPDEGDPTSEDLAHATQALRGSFDPEWAGFGGAPKFPPSMALEFCLRMHLRGEEGALTMATETLHRMADGGMHDQVGGGFHRYSVDRFWHVPHFEKMLYDNAQLARVYLHAWQVSGDERFRVVCERTLDYLLREMRHPDGGFFSSQDADSEGKEGTFFVWGWEELVALVGADVATAFGARPDGNWEGTNVLWTPVPFDRLAEELGRPADDLRDAVDGARATLMEQRGARVRPGTDDKILAAWNGMAIAALAEAGRILDEPRYLDAARDAASFVLTHLRDAGGRLLRSWREGRTSGPAFADDHALLAEGLLALCEATFDERWFVEARSLADALLDLFLNPDGGGFFQTGSDAERLVIRPKDLYDNAVPSGNSAAADLLARMSLFTGESRYEDAARAALRPVREAMRRYPTGFGLALSAADTLTSSVPEIALAGPPDRADTSALADVVWHRYLPTRILAAGGGETIPLLRDRVEVDGHAAAYVCERFVCQRPVTDPTDLAAALDGGPAT